jgi:hypothetical protein
VSGAVNGSNRRSADPGGHPTPLRRRSRASLRQAVASLDFKDLRVDHAALRGGLLQPLVEGVSHRVSPQRTLAPSCKNCRTSRSSGPWTALRAYPIERERIMPRQATGSPVPEELPPRRAAALRKWLRVANSRLLALQRQQQQLVATATTLASGLERGSRRSDTKRPRLAARLAKAG